MAGVKDFTFVRKGHINIEVGAESDTKNAGGSRHALGCVVGDFTVSDSRASDTAEPFESWCALIAAEAADGGDITQVTPGQRTIEFSPTIEIDLSDPNYDTEYTAYRNKTPRQFVVTFVNEGPTGGGEDSFELVVNGYYSGWPTTDRDADGPAGTSRATVSFHANKVVSETISRVNRS